MPNVAPQIGTKYVLVNANGVRVTFNDPTDADNVGVLTNITGLDSAEVREDGENLVQTDGGVHGPFLYGRRPILLEGFIYGHVSDSQRNERVARLASATDAMGPDATLSWQPAGGAAVYSKVRRQQPLKIAGGWNKTFQAAMVAADPRFYGSTLNTITKTTTGASTLVNAGNAESFPLYTLYGSTSTIPNIKRGSTSLVRFSRAIDLDRGYVIDGLNRTVYGLRRRVNHFKNPSFEHGSIGLTSVVTDDHYGVFDTGSPTLDPFAAMPAVSSGFGSKVLKLTTTGTGAIPAPVNSGTEKIATFIPKGEQWASAMNTYKLPDDYTGMSLVVNFSVLRAVGAAAYFPYVVANWLEQSGAYISATMQDGQYRGPTAISDTVWQRISAVFPVAAHKTPLYVEVQIGVQNPTNQAAGQIYYFDAVSVELVPNTTTGFFYPDGVTYGWEGTADNSRTYSLVADPFWPTTLDYKLIDFPNTTWGGLLPGSNSISLDGTFGGGGSLKVDWRDAWL